MELDRTEARVLGALIEKRWTTPEQYPLTLNALVAACNQRSNRDPAMELEEFEISGCILGMRPKGLVLVHERDGGRVPRYSEKLMDELGVSRQEIAILAELLLRGDQTDGELYRRCDRMAHFENQERVEALLRGLAERRFVRLLPRETGQRHARWTQLLCADRGGQGGATEPADAPALCPAGDVPGPGRVAPPACVPAPAAPAPGVSDELAALRAEVAALRARVETLEELLR